MTNPAQPPKAGRREWIALAVLCLPTMLAAVDINIMFLALPHIAEDLGSGGTAQLWMTDIYGFMIAGFLITMGSLGDRIGRRKLLMAGSAVFLVASLFAAFATSTEMLIISRAVLGVAGATIAPSVLGLLRQMFQDPKQMGAAMGLWGTSIMLGSVLGPVVGGLLLGAFWWGSIFIMAVPITGLLLLTGFFLLPESNNPNAPKLDLISVGMTLAGILPLIWGLKEAAREGWSAGSIAAVAIGAVFLVAFVQRQRMVENPLMDLSLFRVRTLSIALLLALSIALVMGGLGLMATQFMQMILDLSAFRVGAWMLLPAIALFIIGNMGTALARKIRPGIVLAGGALVAAVGMVVVAQVTPSSSLALLLIGMAIVFGGGGMIGIMSPFLVMSSAPPEKGGAAGSYSSTVGEFGTALGVAVMGLIGTAVYRGQLTVPSGVPEEAAEVAQESISGAVFTSEAIPGAQGAELLASAESAFTDSFHTVAWIAVVLYVGVAALAAFGLKHVPATGDQPADPMGAQGVEQVPDGVS